MKELVKVSCQIRCNQLEFLVFREIKSVYVEIHFEWFLLSIKLIQGKHKIFKNLFSISTILFMFKFPCFLFFPKIGKIRNPPNNSIPFTVSHLAIKEYRTPKFNVTETFSMMKIYGKKFPPSTSSCDRMSSSLNVLSVANSFMLNVISTQQKFVSQPN